MFKRRPDPEPVTRAEWWHQNHVEWPLNRTLLAAFPDLEVYGRKPATVAMDYRDPASEGVVFRYPPWFHATAGFRQQVVDLIASRLGINDPVAIWRTSGAQPCVVVKARAKLPGVVRWAEVKDLIKAAPDTAPVLGLGLGGTLIDADLEDDSPHILISAGSGGGKSALTRLIAAQALHHGGQVVILDFKRTSHNWAKQLSGVTYCRRIEEIHDALVVLAGIAEERNEAAEDPDAEIGPRIWVIFEELNAASEMLRDWWAMTREKDSPKRSPAITALKHLLFMGRSARVHVVAIAQRLDAQLVGGGSGRENFALRCLTRFSAQAWKMLASDAGPVPKWSRVVGRWHVVKHGEAHECQVVWISDNEARAWASSGRESCDLAIESTRSIGHDKPKHLGHVPARTLVGLREALPLLPGPQMSLDALRKHSQRDDRFPPPLAFESGQQVYDLDALIGWRTGRLAATAIDRREPA